MQKKPLTIKEIFCGQPHLYAYFREMDKTIKAFSPEEGKNGEVEALKKKRSEMLRFVKEMDRVDLQILYYLHSVQRIRPLQLLTALKNLVEAQEELSSLLSGRE